MSKIEVDAIDKQSGSTLTLGGSGTAVTLACGATQSGFGRTGTVDWQTGSIKTATFTAVSGEGYFCNTAGGAFEMDLPAGSAGAIVSVQDYNNTFDTNALTVDPNGSEKINGGDGGESVELSTEGRGVTFVYIDSTVGWRSVQDNDFTKKGVTAQFVTATGGTVTTVCTNFKVHTFTGPGTFCVSCAGNAAGSNTVSYVVVAGGGTGGSALDGGAGGGGAGGYREGLGLNDSYTGSPLRAPTGVPVTATGFPITVGAGSAGAPHGSTLSNGSNSVFSTITSAGGGFGGQGNNPGPSPATAGNPGGSGGGGLGYTTSVGGNTGGTGNTPPVSPPQGNNGGAAVMSNVCAATQNGGGGGGATAVGVASAPSCPGEASYTGGPGGAGATSSINGTPTARAGGGGAGRRYGPPSGTIGSGGAGGGGAGGSGGGNSSVAGTVNTGGGGGGGGGGGPGGTNVGSSGGSGIVIIRYKFQ